MTKETTCGHEKHYAKGLCVRCYLQQPKIKERRKKTAAAYQKRPEVKAKMSEYYKRPEVMAKLRRWRNKPEVKDRINKKARDEYQKFKQEHGVCPATYNDHNRTLPTKELTEALKKLSWLSDESKDAMFMDGDCLRKQLKKHKVTVGAIE